MEIRTEKIDLGNGKSAEIRELTGRQQVNADRAAGGQDLTLIGYYRVLASLQSLTLPGQAPRKYDSPKNDLELDARLDDFTGRELDLMSQGYVKAFLGVDDLKNE